MNLRTDRERWLAFGYEASHCAPDRDLSALYRACKRVKGRPVPSDGNFVNSPYHVLYRLVNVDQRRDTAWRQEVAKAGHALLQHLGATPERKEPPEIRHVSTWRERKDING